MTDRAIDEILKQAVDGAGGEGSVYHIASPLRPVRPLAPPWVWVSAFLLVFAVVAVAGAAALGMHGLRALSVAQQAIVSAVVVAAAYVTAIATMREMIPAGGRRI